MGRYTGKRCRLLSMFGLTGSFFVVELVVGHLTNSMALIADSFHMLSDIAALIIAFISVKMAPKSWDKNTFGWARAEVLGKLLYYRNFNCKSFHFISLLISNVFYFSFNSVSNNAFCTEIIDIYDIFYQRKIFIPTSQCKGIITYSVMRLIKASKSFQTNSNAYSLYLDHNNTDKE